jgi:hypothetical protein
VESFRLSEVYAGIEGFDFDGDPQTFITDTAEHLRYHLGMLEHGIYKGTPKVIQSAIDYCFHGIAEAEATDPSDQLALEQLALKRVAILNELKDIPSADFYQQFRIAS